MGLGRSRRRSQLAQSSSASIAARTPVPYCSYLRGACLLFRLTNELCWGVAFLGHAAVRSSAIARRRKPGARALLAWRTRRPFLPWLLLFNRVPSRASTQLWLLWRRRVVRAAAVVDRRMWAANTFPLSVDCKGGLRDEPAPPVVP